MPKRDRQTHSDAAGDWRDGWGSTDADVTRDDAPRRPTPLSGVVPLNAEAVEHALDEFPSEHPSTPTPNPRPDSLLVRHPVIPEDLPASFARPPAPVTVVVLRRLSRRSVIAAGAAAAILCTMLIGWPSAAADDEVPVAPADPAPLVMRQVSTPPSPRSSASASVEEIVPQPAAARPAPPAVAVPPRSAAPAAALPAAALAVRPTAAMVPGPSLALPPSTTAAVSQPVTSSQPPVSAPAPPAAPALPAATTPPDAAAPLASTAAPRLTDRQVIASLLARYQAAFTQLDANAAKAVWPAVDQAALERAFGQLENQDLTFSQCSLSITGINAVAQCSGSATYLPKVGSRRERTEYRQWEFALWKAGDRWQISSVETH